MPLRIVLADDDPDLRRLLKMRLVRSGFEVTEVGDGLEAVNCVRAQRPDLVILDHMMPRLNGVDACREIREDPAIASTPVVLVTASPETVLEAARAAGVNRVFVKPVPLQELLSAIAGLIPKAA